MASLTTAMQKFIGENPCLIATVGKDGCPNLAPKGTFRVLIELQPGTAAGIPFNKMRKE